MIVVVSADQVADFQLSSKLLGADGSEWDIVNGPVRLKAGVTGLGVSDPEHFWQDSPSLDGSLWSGSRMPRGEAVLKLGVHASDASEQRSLHRALMRAVDPTGRSECRWQIAAPDEPARTMALRYASGSNPEYDSDPLLRWWYSEHRFEFATPDPFWRGPEQTVGLAPGRNIVATRTVEVPGDVATWPRWSIPGPLFGTATVGVGDSLVSMALSVPFGFGRVVDMDPRQTDGYAVRDLVGASRWSDVVDRRFAPIPPGVTEVKAGTDATGSGLPEGYEFSLSFTPGYWQAW
jgi:hypothetical protein